MKNAILLQADIQRRFLAMRARDRARDIFAILRAPARPQPVRRVEPRHIQTRARGFAFPRDPPQHGVDQGFEMHRLAVGGGQIVRRIHRGMGRHFEDQQLARPQQQDLHRRARFVRRGRLGHEMPDQRVQFAEMPQGLAGQRPRETGIARGQDFCRDSSCGIERAALPQHLGEDGQARICARPGPRDPRRFRDVIPTDRLADASAPAPWRAAARCVPPWEDGWRTVRTSRHAAD